MRILVTGSTGFVGRHLVAHLQNEGHLVTRLIRPGQPVGKESIVWDPQRGQIEAPALEHFDCLFHLAGKSVVEKRWSKAFKDQLFRSRCRDTWLLCETLARTNYPPKVVITASAIGYYGERGEERLDENSPRGAGFLAELCTHWERAAGALEQKGVRVAHARFGKILDPAYGILKRLKLAFQLGLCATLGSGKQWMSWIGITDAIRALEFMMQHTELHGPVNVCTDNPVRNLEFTQQYARFLNRYAFLKLPKWLLRLLTGEMADELLLASSKAVPKKLLDHGFWFIHPTLDKFFASYQVEL